MAKNDAGKIEKGLTLALELVSETSLRDVWLQLGELIDNRHLEEIPLAIDGERYRADKAENARALEIFEKSLNPEQQKLYFAFEFTQTRKEYWREVAGFYVGFATALRFGKSQRRFS